MYNYTPVLDYVKDQYKNVLKEPVGLLYHKFIVPGSNAFCDQLWDWDSWICNMALARFAEADISEYEKGCVLNFLAHIDVMGRVPIHIEPEYISPNYAYPEEPIITNNHKPCLAQHAAFIIKRYGNDAEWIRPHFDKLLRFVDFYYKNCRHESGIYFWIDDLAIGVDNDPATFYRPKRSSGNIMLNCFMYKELEAVCFIGELLGEDVSFYQKEQERLLQAIRTHCYDEKDGLYYSVDLNLRPVDPNEILHSGAPRHWNTLIQRIGSWCCFLPMWCGIATPEQAERMVRENLLDEKAFWAPYGVRSLSRYEKMYAIIRSGNPGCFLGPVWIVANYFVFKGLLNYGYTAEAEELAKKTIDLLTKDLAETGTLHEYYEPENGEGLMNPGFLNWNMLAVNMGQWLNGECSAEEA